MALPHGEVIYVGQTVRLPTACDLVYQLVVIVGRRDPLSEHLEEGSQCAHRVCAIRNIAQRMSNELKESRLPTNRMGTNGGMQKREVGWAE